MNTNDNEEVYKQYELDLEALSASPIVYTGEEEVVKCNLLTYLDGIECPLNVYKMLDVIISRVDHSDPSKTRIVFPKTYYEKAIGVKRLRVEAIDEYMTYLQMPVRLVDINNKKNFIKTVLFDTAISFVDNRGRWYLGFDIAPNASAYFFNVDNIGVLRYTCRNTAALKSTYSFHLFMYLVKNTYRGHWEESIENLLEIFHCSGNDNTKQNYENDYRYFNQRIIKPSVEEVSQKTDIHVEVRNVTSKKDNKSVVGIAFKAYFKNGVEKYIDKEKKNFIEKNKERIDKIVELTGFTFEEGVEICQLMYKKRYSDDTLSEIIQYVNKKDKEGSIGSNNKFNYLKGTMSKWKKTAYKPKTNQFTNYHNSTSPDLISEFEKLFEQENNASHE